MKKIIKLQECSIGYGNIQMIENINLSIAAGESWIMIGPNGGGKTTLLKTLLGLIKPVKGICSVQRNIKIGYVPQREELDKIFPVSVTEIVAMGRYSRVPFGKMIKKQDWKIINEAIDQTDVSHLRKSTFSSLSGGERRRVLIARAIAGEPDVLALDEPTSSVDSKGRNNIIKLIEKIQNKRKLTVIIISHHADQMKNLAQNFLSVNKDENIVKLYEKNDLFDGNTFEHLTHH